MIKKLQLIYLILLISSLLLNHSIYAGETGKIAGIVTDAITGEALIGANIIIIAKWEDGQEIPSSLPMGASTNVEGEYFILNIPPGDYNVKVSYIGFKAQLVTKVRVDVDKTTVVDFNIAEEEITTEEVTVTAYTPKTVEKDVTATKQVYNIEDVQSMAGVADISDILELQADVVDDHFRGGRVGESSYLLGGGSIVNPLSNNRAFSPIVTGLQQVEVYTSGFSAEYGNAQSGVVNMITREGGEIWQTRIEGAVIPGYYKTWDGSPYSASNLNFYDTLSSTVSWLDENPTQPGRPLFDAGYGYAGVYLPERNTWPPNPLLLADSLHVARMGQLSWLQSIRDVGLEYDNTPDVRLDFTAGGPITPKLKLFTAARINSEQPKIPTPNSDFARQLMANLTYQLNSSHKLKLRFIYDYSFENYLNSNWERWLFERTFSVSKEAQRTLQYGLSWNYIVNPSTVLDVRLNILDVYSEERIELLSDGQFLEDYSSRTNWVDYTGPSYHRVGRVSDDRGDEQVYSYDIHASILSQVNKNNLIKGGFQFTYFDFTVDKEMNVTNEGSFRNVEFNNFPYEGAIYLQDKMEFGGFIANVGLRLDFYNFNVDYYSDLYSPLRNPDYNPSLPYLERGQYYDADKAATEQSEVYMKLQPRVGLSFPVTESMVFHLNYGTFTQRPAFDQVFYSQVTMFNEIEILGNPRLKPETTKSYDVGLVKAFPLGLKLDVSAYYKDVTDLVETAYFFDEQQSVYRTYINRDYADITGFHVSLEKSIGSFRGYARYNYETATGKSSNALDAPVAFFENPAEGQDPVELPDPEDVFLNYDRTHKAVFNIRYVTNPYFAFNIGDFYPFGDFSISLTWKYYSGRPYTWDDTGQGLKFNKRTPDENDLRMRLEKRFPVGRTHMTLYFEGFNLLNERVFHYSRTFDDERNTPKWENDRENILVYDEYYPYVTNQSIHLQTNLPRHFRLGVIVRF